MCSDTPSGGDVSKGPYEIALNIMLQEEPDEGKALLLLEEAHGESDRRATYALATWYLHGTSHVRKNLRTGNTLLRQAAKDNIPSALYDLAISYEKGLSIKQSDSQALRHYLRAALAGDKQSNFELGRCYYYGIGTEIDKRIAKIWYDHAETLEITE